jgi:flagellar biosynthesis protein FlhA
MVVRQIGFRAKPAWVASGFLALLGVLPGLPTVPFLALAGAAALLARMSGKALKKAAEPVGATESTEVAGPVETTPVQDLLQIDPVELEIGYALVPLVDEGQGGDLMERIRLLRKQAAQELGILVPPIRIRDDVRLPPDEYLVKIRGSEAARGDIRPRLIFALDTGSVVDEIPGEETVDPSFGMPARWIPKSKKVEAETNGYVAVEPTAVLATHLMETLKSHASELLGRQDVQDLLDALKASYPALVEEVVPNKISLGVLHRVLQRLLKERIPIRDLVTILETLADVSEQTKDPEALTEHVRRNMANVIVELHAGEEGSIHGITVGPQLEAALMGLFGPRAGSSGSQMLNPDRLTGLLAQLDQIAKSTIKDGRSVPLITPPGLRVGVRRLIEPVLPFIPVVSLAELPANVNLRTVATWELDHAA